MDLEILKETLDEETFGKLHSYVGDLTRQRDEARSESINGRKQLKERLQSLEHQQDELLNKFNLESLEQLDELPDVKQVDETQKQYEVRMKRLERQLQDAQEAKADVEGKYKSTLQRAAISDALGKHDFIARDLIESFVSSRVTWDGDEVIYKAEDGRLMPLSDGVASIAAARPELLKAVGTGGAGVRSSNARGVEAADSMTRAEFESLPPLRKVEVAQSGIKLID